MPIGFTDKMELIWGERSNVKNDTQDLNLSKGLTELTSTEMGRSGRGRKGEYQKCV